MSRLCNTCLISKDASAFPQVKRGQSKRCKLCSMTKVDLSKLLYQVQDRAIAKDNDELQRLRAANKYMEAELDKLRGMLNKAQTQVGEQKVVESNALQELMLEQKGIVDNLVPDVVDGLPEYQDDAKMGEVLAQIPRAEKVPNADRGNVFALMSMVQDYYGDDMARARTVKEVLETAMSILMEPSVSSLPYVQQYPKSALQTVVRLFFD